MIVAASGASVSSRELDEWSNCFAHRTCPRSIYVEAKPPRLPTGKRHERLLRARCWSRADATIG